MTTRAREVEALLRTEADAQYRMHGYVTPYVELMRHSADSLSALIAECEEARGLLSTFLSGTFDVAVGGNPIAVERFLSTVRDFVEKRQ